MSRPSHRPREGSNVADGGDAADTIVGSPGAERLLGGEGDDVIYGGRGADVIFGGPGADRIEGNRGDVAIDGGLGDDVLFGGVISGLPASYDGYDVLLGRGGSDRIAAVGRRTGSSAGRETTGFAEAHTRITSWARRAPTMLPGKAATTSCSCATGHATRPPADPASTALGWMRWIGPAGSSASSGSSPSSGAAVAPRPRLRGLWTHGPQEGRSFQPSAGAPLSPSTRARPVPSALARQSTPKLWKTSWLASGDHATLW